jgi:hypothetical protein
MGSTAMDASACSRLASTKTVACSAETQALSSTLDKISPVTRLETTVQTVDGRPVLTGVHRFPYELAAEDIDLVVDSVDLEY